MSLSEEEKVKKRENEERNKKIILHSVSGLCGSLFISKIFDFVEKKIHMNIEFKTIFTRRKKVSYNPLLHGFFALLCFASINVTNKVKKSSPLRTIAIVSFVFECFKTLIGFSVIQRKLTGVVVEFVLYGIILSSAAGFVYILKNEHN